MPIITFTPKDKMLATKCEAGYYPATIREIDGPKQSSSGKSINWFFRFSLGGKYEGKEISVAFTSGSESASVLGNMMWMPTANIRQVFAAVLNVAVADVPDTANTDDLIGKPLDVKVNLATVEGGGVENTISEFLPAGKSATAGKLPF